MKTETWSRAQISASAWWMFDSSISGHERHSFNRGSVKCFWSIRVCPTTMAQTNYLSGCQTGDLQTSVTMQHLWQSRLSTSAPTAAPASTLRLELLSAPSAPPASTQKATTRSTYTEHRLLQVVQGDVGRCLIISGAGGQVPQRSLPVPYIAMRITAIVATRRPTEMRNPERRTILFQTAQRVRLSAPTALRARTRMWSALLPALVRSAPRGSTVRLGLHRQRPARCAPQARTQRRLELRSARTAQPASILVRWAQL